MTTMADEFPVDSPVGLLLSRDLIFATKITGTAHELGRRVLWADSPAKAAQMIEQSRPRVIFVDLSAGDLVRPDALLDYKRLAPAAPFVAFAPHIDTAAMASAAEAGCDPVLPRSRFVVRLPELIRAYLGGGEDARLSRRGEG